MPALTVGLLALLLATGAYYRGAIRLWEHAGRGSVVRGWQAWCFGAGAAAALVAIAPPVEWLAARSLWWHMVQHLLLVLVSAPLVAAGAPLLPFLWGLPAPWRRRLHRLRLPPVWRRRLHGASGGVSACLAHVVTLWIWHLPLLYAAAVRLPALHALEHASILGTALWLWVVAVSVGGPVRRPSPAAALVMFGAATLTVGLAALLTLAPAPLYDVYAAGRDPASALHDQRLAGALMWMAGGLVYTAAGATLFGMWLHVDSSAGEPAPAVRPREGSARGGIG